MTTIDTEAKALDPTLLARRGPVDLDGGRPWAGDLYDEGPVSDPDDAFAHFQLGAAAPENPDDPAAPAQEQDVEAWVDKNDDGSMVGWVRDGTDVYRYSDPKAWALDVDGAQMQRTDGGAELALEQPEADPLAAAEPGQGDPLADAETPDAAATGADGELEENPFADLGDYQSPDDAAKANPEEHITADGDVVTTEKDAPDVPASEAGEEPRKGETNALGIGMGANPKDPVNDLTDETEQDKLFGGKAKKQRKDLLRGGKSLVISTVCSRPFEHKAHFAGECDSGGRGDKEPSPSADSRPSTPTPPPAPETRAPQQASLDRSQFEHMSDEDLESLTEQPDYYDSATLLAAAEEYDRRQGPSAADDFLTAVEATPRGSAERAHLYDSVIPEEWSRWVALRNKRAAKVSRNRQEQQREAFRDYKYQQWRAAEDATRGNMWASRYKANPKARPRGVTEEDLLTNRAMAAKYGSPELKEWLDLNRMMTFDEWVSGEVAQDAVRSDLYT